MQVLRVAVRTYFQSADHEMVQAVTCMFSNTPDHHFVIDHHPRHKQVGLLILSVQLEKPPCPHEGWKCAKSQ